jgi:hypothetical protein
MDAEIRGEDFTEDFMETRNSGPGGKIRGAVPLFVLLCALFSCKQVNGPAAENPAGTNTEQDSLWGAEAPDPADYGIDLNAINKNEVLFSAIQNQYTDNPFLGGQWESASGGGFVYFYKTDATVSSTHHCELRFNNQFSYVLYRNWLVICGSEMDADRLELKSLHIPAGVENTLVLFKREPETGALSGYDIFIRTDADANPSNSGEGVTPPYTPFLGRWEGSDGNEYQFNANGVYTVRPQEGAPADYSYMVRGNAFITLSHGETKVEAGTEVWTVKPRVSRRTFSVRGNQIFMEGLTLTKPD